MNFIKNEKIILEDYKKAFKTSSIYKGENLEIKREPCENGRVLIKSNDSIYRIVSSEELRNEISGDLESLDFPEIPLEIWIEAVNDIHLEEVFIENLVTKLENKEEFEALNIAINLSNHASNSPSVFWNTLYYIISEYKLYFTAVEVATKIRKLENLADDITELMIENGDSFLNEMRYGVFISFKFNDKLLHVYTVDPGMW